MTWRVLGKCEEFEIRSSADPSALFFTFTMLAHHHHTSTSYLDASTTHPSQGQKLRKEDLQERLWDRILRLDRTERARGSSTLKSSFIALSTFPVPEVDTNTQ